MYTPAILPVKYYDLHCQLVEMYDVISYQYRDSGGMKGKFAIVVGKDSKDRLIVRDNTSEQKILNWFLTVKVDIDKADLKEVKEKQPVLWDVIRKRDLIKDIYEARRRETEKLINKLNKGEQNETSI